MLAFKTACFCGNKDSAQTLTEGGLCDLRQGSLQCLQKTLTDAFLTEFLYLRLAVYWLRTVSSFKPIGR